VGGWRRGQGLIRRLNRSRGHGRLRKEGQQKGGDAEHAIRWGPVPTHTLSLAAEARPVVNELLQPHARVCAMKPALLVLLTLACSAPFSAPRTGKPAIPEGEDPLVWAEDIAAFAALPPSEEQLPILFYGSSSIRLWKTLAEDMDYFPVLNRGFGGSRLFDAVYWAEEVIADHEPSEIVVFSGTNDIAGESPRSADWVAARFDELVTRVRGIGYEQPLVYLAITPTPAREAHLAIVLEANRLIAARCAVDSSLYFVDTASGVLDANGRPDPRWFVEDGLHLNAAGYAHWTKTLLPLLLELNEIVID